MRKKTGCFFLLWILLIAWFPAGVHAETMPYFTFSLNTREVSVNDEIKVQINANEMPDTAAGFRMAISYDDTRLSFVRTETSSQIKTGTMDTNSAGNPIYSVYVCNVDKGQAPVLSGNIISFVFKVKESAAEGTAGFHARIDQICNYQEQSLNLDYEEDLSFSVLSAGRLSSAAYLKSLAPVFGQLSPSFSPDTFVYSMEVPSNVSSVEFMAEAGEGGSVSINRRTLGKEGSQTSMIASVTSADGQSVVQYVVLVHRAEESGGSVSSRSSSVSQPGSAGSIYLTKLEPLTGELSPEFSPQTFSYNMEVPSNVNSVEFLTEAPNGAKVAVSRHALGRAGSQTSIIITVTSADRKLEADYVVLVRRAAESGTGGAAGATGNNGQASPRNSSPSGKNTGSSAVSAAGTAGNAGGGSAAAQATPQPSRNIIIMGNQMPQYLLLMLLCTNCVIIGLLLSFWLRRRKKE